MRIAARWQITETELWDTDALNMAAPAFIEFAEDGSGRSGFIAVQGKWIAVGSTGTNGPGAEFLLGRQRRM
jgi:hypothetical protein